MPSYLFYDSILGLVDQNGQLIQQLLDGYNANIINRHTFVLSMRSFKPEELMNYGIETERGIVVADIHRTGWIMDRVFLDRQTSKFAFITEIDGKTPAPTKLPVLSSTLYDPVFASCDLSYRLATDLVKFQKFETQLPKPVRLMGKSQQIFHPLLRNEINDRNHILPSDPIPVQSNWYHDGLDGKSVIVSIKLLILGGIGCVIILILLCSSLCFCCKSGSRNDRVRKTMAKHNHMTQDIKDIRPVLTATE